RPRNLPRHLNDVIRVRILRPLDDLRLPDSRCLREYIFSHYNPPFSTRKVPGANFHLSLSQVLGKKGQFSYERSHNSCASLNSVEKSARCSCRPHSCHTAKGHNRSRT